jgi:nitronate monooxygenase
LLVVPEGQAYIRAMTNIQMPLVRAQAFCERFGLRLPIFLAPMAGVPAPALSIAVANAGGVGACGALLMQPDMILQWAQTFRAGTAGPFQFNLWIPDPAPRRDQAHEALVRAFLAQWGPPVAAEVEGGALPNFDEQCAAVLAAAPPFVSSIMGVYPERFVAQLKERGIRWFANASTVAEARAAEAAGADVIIAQGMEAGGHRGSFDAANAERELVGLFALVPAIVDAVRIPVVATGGIADARGIAAALVLGASAVQIGTGFLRCPEAGIPPAWANALAQTTPERTMLTRAYSGRAGRSIATSYARAAADPAAPAPAPYPIQRALTKPLREIATREGDIERMHAWAGQSAALAQAKPAATLTTQLWQDARPLLA